MVDMCSHKKDRIRNKILYKNVVVTLIENKIYETQLR